MGTRVLSSLLAAACLAGAAVAQTPTWKPQLLGPPDPAWSSAWPVAVNDAGLVVGNTYVQGWKHAWWASPTQVPQLLPLPTGATYSDVHDVNGSGVAVGQVLEQSGASRAIVWQPSGGGYTYQLLPAGPGGHTPFDARGVNDRGDVVGKYGVLGNGYVWNATDGVVQLTYAAFPKVPEDVNEQRQVVADHYRMDLDSLVLEVLGSPSPPYGIMYTKLGVINDAGQCAGYSVAATSSSYKYVAVRYTDGLAGPEWTLFTTGPQLSANALHLSAAGDTVYQLGQIGTFVSVTGHGSLSVQGTLDPAYADWDLTGSFVPAISRGGLLAANGLAPDGQGGIVLLTPTPFESLGGSSPGALGDPVLDGHGTLVPGEPTRLRLSSGATNGLALLGWSGSSTPLPLFGGTLHASPLAAYVALPTDHLGRFELSLPWPALPVGSATWLQAAVVDPQAAFGVALSNALRAVTR